MTDTPPVDIRFEIRLNADSPRWTREEYDRIYSTRGIRQLDSFYKWILDQIRPRPGARLLDVACGEGTLSHFAEKRYALRAYGSDLSVSALQIAAGEAAGPFAVGSGEELPYADGSFDYVTCIGSLEHFLDVRAGVREMARVLRPDGVACIFVPNTYSLLGNILKAWRTGMSTVDFQPMQRYAARGEWELIFRECGLETLDVFKWDREPPYSLRDLLWYVERPRDMFRMLVGPLIPTNLANHLGFLLRRAPGAPS
jgi:SAM-dependent methyltransferase